MWTNAFMKQFVWISTFLSHSKTGINPQDGFCHEYFLQLIEFCFPVTSFDRITVSPLQLVSKPNRVRFIASAWVWWVLVRFVQSGRINTNAPWLPRSQFTLIHIFSWAINLETKSGILTRCVLRVLTIDCLHIYPSLNTVTLTSLC